MESMTGFGSSAGEKGVSWTWTLRSVNGKGLEIRCRLPYGYEALEPEVRNILRQNFARGNVAASLEFTANEEQSTHQINMAFLEELCHIAMNLQEKHPVLKPASIDGLLNVRGVAEQKSSGEDQFEERQKLLLNSFEEAVQSLKQARQAEGDKISVNLKASVDNISELTDKAKALAAKQPDRIRRTLMERIKLLPENMTMSEDRFMQEVTAILLRIDITEEIDRLHAHIKTARELFVEKGSVGRKLDFLCQEFNREANTLCSKSTDIELTQTGMALKTVIDQLREQIQNIE